MEKGAIPDSNSHTPLSLYLYERNLLHLKDFYASDMTTTYLNEKKMNAFQNKYWYSKALYSTASNSTDLDIARFWIGSKITQTARF